MRFQFFTEDGKFHLIDAGTGQLIRISGNEELDMPTIDKAHDIAEKQFPDGYTLFWGKNHQTGQTFVTVTAD